MFQKLKIPLLCIVCFGGLILLWKLFKLPSEDLLITMIKDYFVRYGVVTILIAAAIEGALVVGWYLPGGLVIFLGVILAAGDPYRAALSVIATIVGLTIAYTFNYFMGTYGWYKVLTVFGLKQSLVKAEAQFQKHGYKAMILTYWQPNFAALISTSAGVLKAPFATFFAHSLLATIVWSTFWGIAAYVLGQQILQYLGIVFMVILLGWIGWIVIEHFWHKKHRTPAL